MLEVELLLEMELWLNNQWAIFGDCFHQEQSFGKFFLSSILVEELL